jgi:peptidoglycan/LPS O-acetylase OafA/YrhL
MRFERWFQAPRRLPLLFLAVTLIPVLALGWLTSQLVEKDRRLEKQQGQERVEHAADRIVAASHQRLAELESQLRRLAITEKATPPDDTVLAIAEGDRVTVAPACALV